MAFDSLIMQYNVAQLLKEPIGSSRSYQLDEHLNGVERFADHLGGSVTLLKTLEGVLVHLGLGVDAVLACGRCLAEYPLKLTLDIEEEFFTGTTSMQTADTNGWVVSITPSGAWIPTVIAGKSPAILDAVKALISNDYLTIQTSEDLIGVQLGGVLKNVIAIAAGMGDGLGYGNNFKSALVTLGLSEMIVIGERFGARKETFQTSVAEILTSTQMELFKKRFSGKRGRTRVIRKSHRG